MRRYYYYLLVTSTGEPDRAYRATDVFSIRYHRLRADNMCYNGGHISRVSKRYIRGLRKTSQRPSTLGIDTVLVTY